MHRVNLAVTPPPPFKIDASGVTESSPAAYKLWPPFIVAPNGLLAQFYVDLIAMKSGATQPPHSLRGPV